MLPKIQAEGKGASFQSALNAPVTRRALLGATAAVSVAALPAVTVAQMTISASGADADLFALLDHWREARAALDASWEAFEAASDRERDARPPQPDALSRSSSDFPRTSYGRGASDAVGDTGRREYGVRGVHWLRRVRPVARWSETAEARRQEIVGAYDGWMQARKAVEDATGYTTADEAVQAGIETLNAAEEAAKLCGPSTLAGLVRKAAWVADLLARDAGDDDLGEVFARQVAAFGGVAS